MVTQQQTEHFDYDKVWRMFQETDRKFQETDRKFQETDRKFQETDRKFQETKELMSRSSLETDRKFQETDKYLKELGRQIGGIGNKFGTFTEGLYMPSLEKMLIEKFSCFKRAANYEFTDNGNTFEIDMLGVASGACYILEIKSHLRKEAIKQIIKKIKLFKKFDKDAIGKKVFGAIVATHYSKEITKQVTENGIYFISTVDDIAKLSVPSDFTPRAW